MDRRKLIGAALVISLIAGNAAVYWLQRQPTKTPPDTRQILRRQLTSDWDDLPTAPLTDATTALTQAIESKNLAEDMDRLANVGRLTGFDQLDEPVRNDLIKAVGDAITAIGSAKPEQLIQYMESRGLKPDRRLLARALSPADGTTSPKQLTIEWENAGLDPHWDGLVPDAIAMRVYRPSSLRQVSLIYLGRSESWVWSNQTVFPTVFITRPTYEQVSRGTPARLADVRVLIEHDDILDRERSPYFFRFWYAEDRKKWQPIVLKLVRTESDGSGTPTLLF